MFDIQVIRTILQLAHRTAQKVLPDLANEVTVTSAAASWVYGTYAQLVASTTTQVQVLRVHVVSITGNHQIAIATGAAASEVVVAELLANAVGVYDISIPVIDASTRIAAKTASKAVGAQACAIKLEYVEI